MSAMLRFFISDPVKIIKLSETSPFLKKNRIKMKPISPPSPILPSNKMRQ